MAKYDNVKIEGISFKPGERWFLIRGQDRFAPAAIAAYADIIEGSASTSMTADVREVAERMRQWQQEHPELVKTPD